MKILIASVLILILISFFCMRYQKKEFSFSGGSDFSMVAKEKNFVAVSGSGMEKSVNDSFSIFNDFGKKPLPIVSLVPCDYVVFAGYEYRCSLVTGSGGHAYEFRVYRRTFNSDWSVVYTHSADGPDTQLFVQDGYLYAVYMDVTETYHYNRTYDSVTWEQDVAVPYSFTFSSSYTVEVMSDSMLNGYYYGVALNLTYQEWIKQTFYIVRSTDKKTWESVYVGTSNFHPEKIFFLGDRVVIGEHERFQTYALNFKANLRFSIFDPVSLSLEKTRVFYSLGTTWQEHFYRFDDEIVFPCVTDQHYIVTFFDGYNFRSKRIKKISDVAFLYTNAKGFMRTAFQVGDRFYFNVSHYVYFVEKDLTLYEKCYDLLSTFANYSSSDYLYFYFVDLVSYLTVVYIDNTSEEHYQMGSLTLDPNVFQSTAIYDLPPIYDSIIPKQIVLRHDELSSGGTLSVYHSIDGSSFVLVGTATASENGGDVVERYNIKSGEVDRYQLRLVLTSLENDGLPADDISLSLLFVPNGMDYAQ